MNAEPEQGGFAKTIPSDERDMNTPAAPGVADASSLGATVDVAPADPSAAPTTIRSEGVGLVETHPGPSRFPSASEPGGLFGHFQVTGLLGQGGMGQVFRARDGQLHRDVALKTLRPELALLPSMGERFVREARSAASLNHPNIVQVYAAGLEGSVPFFAMELVEGQSLKEAQAECPNRRMPAERAFDAAIQAAKGLRAAWEKGIVHRDVKPGNLMVDRHGVVKIADFGLAKSVESNFDLTRSGAMVGSPYYMSPEQSDGAAATFRSDIYSLGATLFQLLVGSPPFDAQTPLSLMMKHANDPVPRPDTLASIAGGEAHRVIARMMAKKPEARHDSYDELIADLENLHALARVGRSPSLSGIAAVAAGEKKPSKLKKLLVRAAWLFAAMALGGAMTVNSLRKKGQLIEPGQTPVPAVSPTPAPVVELADERALGANPGGPAFQGPGGDRAANHNSGPSGHHAYPPPPPRPRPQAALGQPNGAPPAPRQPGEAPAEMTAKPPSLSILEQAPAQLQANPGVRDELLRALLDYDYARANEIVERHGEPGAPLRRTAPAAFNLLGSMMGEYVDVLREKIGRGERIAFALGAGGEAALAGIDGTKAEFSIEAPNAPPERVAVEFRELNAITLAHLFGLAVDQPLPRDLAFRAVFATLYDLPMAGQIVANSRLRGSANVLDMLERFATVAGERPLLGTPDSRRERRGNLQERLGIRRPRPGNE